MMKQVLLLVSCLAVKGFAGCPDMCPFNYNPVCGSNGETYSNECSLKVHACQLGDDMELTMVSKGECPEMVSRTEPAVENRNAVCVAGRRGCPRIYKPVCGSDKHTYPNECELCRKMSEAAVRTEIRIRHEGECTPAETGEDAQARGSKAGGRQL
ncbi:thrombin inhibitor rhodniin-like [Branchiostoma lanceolatum]|uniref:thrombin inhibitor rhodniin-like n=1 Tax=Branchiostoma lanceolatum TaxID=7740 RepID=UPI003456E04D